MTGHASPAERIGRIMRDYVTPGLGVLMSEDDIRWLAEQVQASVTKSSHITVGADAAIQVREATPGMPQNGPYPATVGEVADELASYVVGLDRSVAAGVLEELRDRLNLMGSSHG